MRCRSRWKCPRRWTRAGAGVDRGGDGSATSALELELMAESIRGALVGELRYLVGSAHGWLGGLGFGAAALRLRDRDRWIAWDEEQRRAHLHRVVGLSRFLIRPSVRCRNLASRSVAAAGSGVPGALRSLAGGDLRGDGSPRWGQFARQTGGFWGRRVEAARSGAPGCGDEQATYGYELCRDRRGWGWDRRKGGESDVGGRGTGGSGLGSAGVG